MDMNGTDNLNKIKVCQFSVFFTRMETLKTTDSQIGLPYPCNTLPDKTWALGRVYNIRNNVRNKEILTALPYGENFCDTVRYCTWR